MFAVIQTGGKQYKIRENDVIRVEKLELEKGVSHVIDKVLMAFDGNDLRVGTPLLASTHVEVTVIDQIRDRKVIVFKKKRRQNYRRKKGHRQHLSVLKIDRIVLA